MSRTPREGVYMAVGRVLLVLLAVIVTLAGAYLIYTLARFSF